MFIPPASAAVDETGPVAGGAPLLTPQPCGGGIGVTTAVSLVPPRNDGVGLGAILTTADGSSGAFVSAWTVDRGILPAAASAGIVTSPNHSYHSDDPTCEYFDSTARWGRLCSADFPAESALRHGHCGTRERLFLGGERVGSGRAWARIATGPDAGTAWELPRLGKMPFANVVAWPHAKQSTVVALFTDRSVDTAAGSHCSELFIYIGKKQSEGYEIERAGLTNGRFYGLRVYCGETLVTKETPDFGLGNATTGYVANGRFDLVQLGMNGDVSRCSGPELEQEAIANNVFRMFGPGDGAWDERGDGHDGLYFITSESFHSLRNNRLWRLRFDDVEHPEQGGRLDILVTRTSRTVFDHIAIDKLGRMVVRENAGVPTVSRRGVYGVEWGTVLEFGHHDRELVHSQARLSQFVDDDDHSAGMIDAQEFLGEGWFLVDAQDPGHDGRDPEPDPGRLLLAVHVRPWM